MEEETKYDGTVYRFPIVVNKEYAEAMTPNSMPEDMANIVKRSVARCKFDFNRELISIPCEFSKHRVELKSDPSLSVVIDQGLYWSLKAAQKEAYNL